MAWHLLSLLAHHMWATTSIKFWILTNIKHTDLTKHELWLEFSLILNGWNPYQYQGFLLTWSLPFLSSVDSQSPFRSCLSKTLNRVYLQKVHLGTITVNFYGPTHIIFTLTIWSLYYILYTVNYIQRSVYFILHTPYEMNS